MEMRAELRGWLLRAGMLVGALIAFTLIINLSIFDEPLRPELEALAAPRSVDMSGNAYPLIYGLTAAEDRDARAAGLAILEKLGERHERGLRVSLSAAEMDETLGAAIATESWQSAFPSLSCNSRMSMNCADLLIGETLMAGPPAPVLARLLGRYDEILASDRFQESQAYDIHTNVPPYGELMALGRIRLAYGYPSMQRQGNAADVSADTVAVFLTEVGKDVRFWKGMLRDGQSLVAKMVALAGLRNDLTYLSALMRDRDLDAGYLATMNRLLRPFTEAERDIGETYPAELRILLLSEESFGAALGAQTWLTRLTSQRNATFNEYYTASVVPLQLRASLSAGEFYRQAGHERLSYSVRVFPPPLYNLGGKLELRQKVPMNIQDYISRVHDLDGRISLVLLQAEIEASSGRRVEDVVRASVHRNPYTVEPMRYEAAAGTLSFECLANPEDICGIVLVR